MANIIASEKPITFVKVEDEPTITDRQNKILKKLDFPSVSRKH